MEKSFIEMSSRQEKIERLLEDIVQMTDEEFDELERAAKELRGKRPEDTDEEKQLRQQKKLVYILNSTVAGNNFQ